MKLQCRKEAMPLEKRKKKKKKRRERECVSESD